MLNFLRQCLNLSVLLRVGERDVHVQHMAQRIHGHMHFASLLAFIAIIARTLAAFARRLQRLPLENHCAGLSLKTLCYAKHRAQIR